MRLCTRNSALIKQLANDVKAASLCGFDPSAKVLFQSLALYEMSTSLQMSNAAMMLNIPRRGLLLVELKPPRRRMFGGAPIHALHRLPRNAAHARYWDAPRRLHHCV